MAYILQMLQVAHSEYPAFRILSFFAEQSCTIPYALQYQADKAKPVVNQGRKAKGSCGKIAWLPLTNKGDFL